jgi:hypothetical protein
MNEDFKRKMRAFDSRQKHTAEQEFAGVRQCYHSLPVQDRRKLKQDLESLAEIADRVAVDWSMFVKVDWSCEQYDDEGNVTFSIGASKKSAKHWLQAIELWDETEPFVAASEEGS